MRIPIIITMCVALVGVATAQTLTIQTEPSGQELWRGEESLGISPVTLEGPFDGPVEITIKNKENIYTSVIEIPENGNDIDYIISTKDKKGNFSFRSLGLGVLAFFAEAGIITLIIIGIYQISN